MICGMLYLTFCRCSSVLYTRVAEQLAPSLPTFTDLQSQSSLCLFTPLSCGGVTKLILSAPAKQSSLDPTPTWLLKDCVDLLSPYLTHLFNASLSLGCVPDLFKVAYITPLLKKPGSDVDATENYRPVSNLPVLSKTLERAVSQQMESYLSAAGLLPRHQSAYRKGHSTETVSYTHLTLPTNREV